MKKRFKVTYLHAGIGKTGTSSIQRALFDNVKVLENNFDILFPIEFDDPRPFKGNHTLLLSSLFMKEAESKRANVLAGFHTPELLEAANNRVLSAYKDSFENSPASNLLLSAEGVSRFNRDSMSKLSRWLYSFSEKVVVIVCLRHPTHAINSMVQQHVKAGGVLEEIYQDPPYYPFQSLFTSLADCFGRENIIPYDFGCALKHNDGIIGAFLDQINISSDLISQRREKTNQSMSQEAVVLLSSLNKQYPSIKGKALGAMRTRNDIIFFKSIPGQKFCVPKSVIDKLSVAVSPQLEWLKKEYSLVLEPLAVDSREDQHHFSEEAIDHIAVKLSRLLKVLSKQREQS